MLELKQITKKYQVGEKTVDALNGITTSFAERELTAVLGSSGCGKTTLMNIIGGLDRATSGDLVIEGRSTKKYKDKDWNNYRNHQIGFVFQAYNLIPHMSVASNVELALTLSGVSAKERKKRVVDALTKVGLSDQLYKKPNQMSGGQMQRVAIARALVNNPKILLADEPTGAVDSKTGIQIMEILKEVSKECLVILVTHNQELANRYADRIIRMQDGLIISDKQSGTEVDLVQINIADENAALSANKAVSPTKPTLPNEHAKLIGQQLLSKSSAPIDAYLSRYLFNKPSRRPLAKEFPAAKKTLPERQASEQPKIAADTNKPIVEQPKLESIKQVITEELEPLAENKDFGNVATDDTNIIQQNTEVAQNTQPQVKRKKANMSFLTAAKLSFNNLLNKKGRSFVTIISGAISVICIALILAMNSGFGYYISDFEKNNLSKFPIKVTTQTSSVIDMLNDAFTQDGQLNTQNVSINSMLEMFKENEEIREKYTDTELIFLSKLILGVIETGISGFQNMDEFGFENEYDFLSEIFGVSLGTDIIEFMKVLETDFDPEWGAVMRNYGIDFDTYRVDELGGELRLNPVDMFITFLEESGLLALLNLSGGGNINALLYGEEMNELRQVFDNNNPWSMMIDDASLLETQYDILAGRLPAFGTDAAKNEIVLVVDEFNQLDDFTLFLLGIIEVESFLLTVVNYIRPLLPEGADTMLDYFLNLLLPPETEEIKLEYEFSDFIGDEDTMPATFTLRIPTDYYALDEDTGIYNSTGAGTKVEVVGVLRLKEGVSAGVISGAIGYTELLATSLINKGNDAPVVAALKQAMDDTNKLRDALINIAQRFMGTEFEIDGLSQIAIPQRVAILQQLMAVAGDIEFTEEQAALFAQIAQELSDFEFTPENQAVLEELVALLVTLELSEENYTLLLQAATLLEGLDPNEENIDALMRAASLLGGLDDNQENIAILIEAVNLLSQLDPSEENISAVVQAINLLSELDPSEENIDAISQALNLLSGFDFNSENIQTLVEIITLLSELNLSEERIDTIIAIVEIFQNWDTTADPEIIQEIFETATLLEQTPNDLALLAKMATLLTDLSSNNRELMLEALPLMLELGLTRQEIDIILETTILAFSLDLNSDNLQILVAVATIIGEFELTEHDTDILMQTADIIRTIEISQSDTQILVETITVLSAFNLSDNDMQILVGAAEILAEIEISQHDTQIYMEVIDLLSQIAFSQEEVDTFVEIYYLVSELDMQANDMLVLQKVAELALQLDISEEEQAKLLDLINLIVELEITEEDIDAVSKSMALIQQVKLSEEEQAALQEVLALAGELEQLDIAVLGDVIVLIRQISLQDEEQEALWQTLELIMDTLGFTDEDILAVVNFAQNILSIDISDDEIDFIIGILPSLSNLDLSLGQTEILTQLGGIFKIRNITVAENIECTHAPDAQHTLGCAWFDSAQYNTLLNSFDLRDIMRPNSVHIYPFSIESRNSVLNFINNFNLGVLANEELSGSTIDYTVLYIDELSEMTASMSTMINTITYILIGVAAIAVIVAMLLVAIILYISVQDRTKEIGLLRSLGASKGNVSSVFIAETFIIGLVSGVVGVLLALVLTFPANIIINSTLGISGLLRPVWWHQFALIGIAFVITVISGLIPAALAAKKDPVLALRTE